MDAIEYALSDTVQGTDLTSAREVGPWLAGFAVHPRFAGEAARGYSEAVRIFHVQFRSECTTRGILVPDAAVHEGRCVALSPGQAAAPVLARRPLARAPSAARST